MGHLRHAVSTHIGSVFAQLLSQLNPLLCHHSKNLQPQNYWHYIIRKKNHSYSALSSKTFHKRSLCLSSTIWLLELAAECYVNNNNSRNTCSVKMESIYAQLWSGGDIIQGKGCFMTTDWPYSGFFLQFWVRKVKQILTKFNNKQQ